jgi:hypothetical protein
MRGRHGNTINWQAVAVGDGGYPGERSNHHTRSKLNESLLAEKDAPKATGRPSFAVPLA